MDLDKLSEIARKYDLEPELLLTVAKVESSGSGFLDDHRLKILFEKHVMWKRLKTRGIDPHLLNHYDRTLCSRYWLPKAYLGGRGEWSRIRKIVDWAAMNYPSKWESYQKAAYESCSWGMFQLMGYHYKSLGFENIYTLIEKLGKGEEDQVEVILIWMENNGLLERLKKKDWVRFARGYNGLGQVPKYSLRLKKTYSSLKKI